MNRRQLLKNTGLLGIGASLSLTNLYAHYNYRNPAEPTPGFLNFLFGELELMLVTDGHIVIEPVQPIFAPAISKEAVVNEMYNNFMMPESIDAAINVLVIKKSERIIIIDTGCGTALGHQAGHFIQNLRAAGISADQVTDVFITHCHVDHIGGILDGQGNCLFPKATFHLAREEYHFWMSENPDFSKSKDKGSNEEAIALARKVIHAIEEKLKLYDFGTTLFTCLRPELAAGHTPGHPILHIFSGEKQLTHMVDLVHTKLLLAQPTWGTLWDTDFDKGIHSRLRVLKTLGIHKNLAMSCHLPWPGIGYITQKANGYDWVPFSFSTPQLFDKR